MEGRKVYRCPVCGYEYVGDLESEPDDYVCPLCGQPKKAFVPGNDLSVARYAFGITNAILVREKSPKTPDIIE